MKARIFMWCLIVNKVPTWDSMKKRQIEGPGRCTLCQSEEEIVPHLFSGCPYTLQTWKECSSLLNQDCQWRGDSAESSWKDWLSVASNKFIKSSSSHCQWGNIWLSRNSSIFQDKKLSSEIIAAQGINILAHFPQVKGSPLCGFPKLHRWINRYLGIFLWNFTE